MLASKISKALRIALLSTLIPVALAPTVFIPTAAEAHVGFPPAELFEDRAR